MRITLLVAPVIAIEKCRSSLLFLVLDSLPFYSVHTTSEMADLAGAITQLVEAIPQLAAVPQCAVSA